MRCSPSRRRWAAFFIRLMQQECASSGFELASPRDSFDRGSHVSYAHNDAYAICQALFSRGVVGDFRTPDLLRLGFSPLYTSFTDVFDAVATVRDVMAERAWDPHCLPDTSTRHMSRQTRNAQA